MKKLLLTTAMILMMCASVFAQYEWKNPPKSSEIIIGTVETSISGGYATVYETDKKGKKYGNDSDSRIERSSISDESAYSVLLEKAKNKYGQTYPKFALRGFKYEGSRESIETSIYIHNVKFVYRYFDFSAIVVITTPEAEANENISQAITKAFRNVRQGSRIAIDQVSVWSGIDREDYKDKIIDVLLDKGYKVVAKEYLDKLYEEQQAQQSGIYNDRTTVQTDNFSAVGYYINVKVTETSLRVQVVNVSTGEYEGNATVNF
jgi:hypothetical protein